VGEQLEREVDLSESHAPQAEGEALIRLQAQRALAAALSCRAAFTAGLSQGDPDAQGDRRRDRGRQRRDNGTMPSLPPAPWWTVRRAANRKPATYRCPICDHHLPALSEHMLIAPEGDTRRRRHAHTECVLRARSNGQLLLRDEWLRTQPRPQSLWRRLLRGA